MAVSEEPAPVGAVRATAGAVMIIGGAEDKRRDRVILSRFIEFAGGSDSHIVVVSTASSLGELAAQRYSLQDLQQTVDQLDAQADRLEERIAQLEKEKKAAETQLADPGVFGDPARSTPLVASYRDAQRKLEELYARWEHKQEQLQAAEAQIV
jgi:cyanophycinase